MNRMNFPDSQGQRIGSDHLKYLQESIVNELFSRSIRYSSPGIVSGANPTSADSPLMVTAGSSSITVTGGACLLDNGELLILSDSVTLDMPTDGREYVIALRASDVQFHEQLTMFEENIKTLVRTDPSVSMVPSSQAALLSNTELLGLWSAANGVELTSSKLTLRRWSSCADWVHRGKIGSGMVTDKNAHGLAVFDMALNKSTGFWNALERDALLLAGHDAQYQHIRGTLVKEVINPGQWRVLEAGNGEYTGGAVAPLRFAALSINCICPVNKPNQPYRAAHSPRLAMLGRADYSDMANLDREVCITPAAFKEIQGKIVEVHYFVASTGNFAVSTSNPYELSSLAPDLYEVYIVNGQSLDELDVITFDLADRSDYPTRYVIEATPEHGIALWPRLVVKSQALTGIASPFTLDFELDYSARLRVVLSNTNWVAGMSATIRITGKDASGGNMAEDVTIDDTWDLQDLQANGVTTSALFKSVSTIQVIATNLIDLTASIQLQAYTEGYPKSAVASFDLSLTGIENLSDRRSVMLAPVAADTPADQSDRIYFSMDNFTIYDPTKQVGDYDNGEIWSRPFILCSPDLSVMQPYLNQGEGFDELAPHQFTLRLDIQGSNYGDYDVTLYEVRSRNASTGALSLFEVNSMYGPQSRFTFSTNTEMVSGLTGDFSSMNGYHSSMPLMVKISLGGKTKVRGIEFQYDTSREIPM